MQNIKKKPVLLGPHSLSDWAPDRLINQKFANTKLASTRRDNFEIQMPRNVKYKCKISRTNQFCWGSLTCGLGIRPFDKPTVCNKGHIEGNG